MISPSIGLQVFVCVCVCPVILPHSKQSRYTNYSFDINSENNSVNDIVEVGKNYVRKRLYI